MLALKRIVTVAVMVYLLLALLLVLAPAVRTTVMDMGSGLSELEKERSFYYTLFLIGVGLLALHLITENLDSVLLRRSVSQQENKINELKAKLYDHQQRTTAPVAVATARTVDGRTLGEPLPAHPTQSQAAGTVSNTEYRTPDHLPQPTFPQSDPSLSNTPPAERPPLA
ncbi:hypothetical protein [Hymenobacter properus]|uniref:Uncharacterized protein n=1 Tax=Hymenobacter properus TaxID=2791026 RepID=A0A931BMZ7_9BACT|nr:hypothetical protein [Hymenobacter properus]MBF9142390.1 hypothetical protein [Hymenobacter properus]MBR7721197.1 hypothetical protein [Microvirga sp. SRT04]